VGAALWQRPAIAHETRCRAQHGDGTAVRRDAGERRDAAFVVSFHVPLNPAGHRLSRHQEIHDMKTLIRCATAAAFAAVVRRERVGGRPEGRAQRALSVRTRRSAFRIRRACRPRWPTRARSAAQDPARRARRRLRPERGRRNARKLIEEEKCDVIMGTSGVPSALAMAQVAKETSTR
jgi:hypothetical protein